MFFKTHELICNVSLFTWLTKRLVNVDNFLKILALNVFNSVERYFVKSIVMVKTRLPMKAIYIILSIKRYKS